MLLEVNVKCRCEEDELLPSPLLYHQLVMSLNYLTITWLGISFAVKQVSQFMYTPFIWLLFVVSLTIWRVLLVAAYLFILILPFNQLVIMMLIGLAARTLSAQLQVGVCFLVLPFITWKIKKQARVSKFSIDSEYRIMSITCCEIIWLRGLLADLWFPQPDPTNSIQITASLVFHERLKHIEVNCRSIHEAFDNCVIWLPNITLDLQLADVFTKAIPRPHHQFLIG